jgi:hypothetical protein
METTDGTFAFQSDNVQIKQPTDGLTEWEASSVQHGVRFDCKVYMEYDGYLRYRMDPYFC